VQRGACRERLRLDEFEPQRRGQILEQGKSVAECDRLQDQPVLVNQPESAQRLGERRASPGEQVLPWLALDRRDLVNQLATRDA